MMTQQVPITTGATDSPITHYDYIYVDACSWMSAEMESFLQQVAPILRSCNRQLIMTGSVQRELENCAPLKYAAQTALQLKAQYTDIIRTEDTPSVGATADGEFVRLFFFNHRKRRQLLITHDQQLVADIQNICSISPDENPPSTAIMTLWSDGELITFSESTRRKEHIARMRLAEMVGNSPIYLDGSALMNELARHFLHNISYPMQSQDKQLGILANSLTPELRAMVAPLLSEHRELLREIPCDPTLTETDALLGELYLNPDHIEIDRLILVTDDVARANELRNRRPKCDKFPYIDFMTINKYGYLSYLKLSEPAAQPTPSRPHTRQMQPRYHEKNYRRNERNTTQERKPAAYVPQLIGAIKSGDVEVMRSYIAKGANLRNGIITSLCQEQNACLRALLEDSEGGIDPSCFDWWVNCYNSFEDPLYLEENDDHFELLCLLIKKSAPMHQLTEAMTTLAERLSEPEAAHDRLWTIIRLALRNGAPSAVYSHNSGETLPEIALRQGNEEMLRFLQSR